MAKFCSECGKELENEEMFCTKCGAKAGGSENHAETQTSALTEHSKKKKIILCVVAAMVLLVGAVSLLGGNNLKSGSSSSESSAVITVKAEDLMKDYIRDQGIAETKYKDKEVNVTGKVLNKSQFNNSSDFFMMLATTNAAGKNYNLKLRTRKTSRMP